MEKLRLRYLFIGCMVLFFQFIPLVSFADIYMYIDKDGVRHFTNVPSASKNNDFEYRLYLDTTKQRNRQHKYFDNLDAYIVEASFRHGVSFSLIKAIIKVESNFDPMAISNKGAMGLMQIMPFNFGQLSISDPFDPWENIMGGVLYLKNMLNKFKGNLPLSIAAYNAGPGAVDKYGCIPPYPETIDYVDKVLKYYAFYQEKK